MRRAHNVLVCLLWVAGVVAIAFRAPADAPQTWRYVESRDKPGRVALPPGFKTCESDKDTLEVQGSITLRLWRPDRAAEKQAQCADAQAEVKIEMQQALRKVEVKEHAFHWDPRKDGKPDAARARVLSVYLQLGTSVDRDVLSNTRLQLDGAVAEASFDRVNSIPGLPIYIFTDLPPEVARTGGQISLVPLDKAPLLPLDKVPRFDAETGKPWNERLSDKQNWLADTGPRSVRFANPQVDSTIERVRAPLDHHPLDRFVTVGLPVDCGGIKEACILSRSDDQLFVEADRGALSKLAGGVLFLPTSAAIVMQVTVGQLTTFKPSAALKVTECQYEITQLTRVEAGMSHVQSLHRVERPRGSVGECSERDWTIIARKQGGAEVVATGALTITAPNLALITWDTLPRAIPNVHTKYDIELTYPGGQRVAMKSDPRLLVEPALDLTSNLRIFASLDERMPAGASEGVAELTARKALATRRENHVELPALLSPKEWKVQVIGARTYYPVCAARGAKETSTEESPTTRLCIEPLTPTDKILELRATRTARVQDTLLPTVNGELSRNQDTIQLGFIEFSTGLTAKPYRIAADVEKYFKVVCGDRVIGLESFRQPTSVDYAAFNGCALVFDSKESGYTAEAFVKRYGTQLLAVTAAIVPKDKSAPKLEPLMEVAVEPKEDGPPPTCPIDRTGQWSCPINMKKAAGGDAEEYAIVQIEIRPVQAHYETSATTSKHESELVVRIRRRPEFLTISGVQGRGVRAFLTMTIAPFTLFRAPHSGQGARTSSEADRLEAATFGVGFISVLETWDFDRNAPFLPFLSPQLHLGLLSTLPTKTTLDYPTFSIVAGLGLRTGVDTAPDASVESSLKVLLWYERLWTFDESRANNTGNLLFGFGADIGTLGN